MLKLLRSYLFWTYERGSFHYDVMVTLILLFLFLVPRLIDFKDRPVETVALHASEVLVKEAATRTGTAASSTRCDQTTWAGRKRTSRTGGDAASHPADLRRGDAGALTRSRTRPAR